MKRWCWALGLVPLVGCASSEATPTTTVSTVAIAAPTSTSTTQAPTTAPATAPPSTALPPTTAPQPTAPSPATSAPADAAEIAKTEIEDTLTALNTEIYDCFEAPEACDIDTVLDRFFTRRDIRVRRIFKDVWQKRIDNNQIKISDGLIERKIAWITTDEADTVGTSFLCEIDGSFNIPKDTPVDASTTVPPDLTRDYLRFYYQWERQTDGSWKITYSEFSGGRSPGAVDTGELPTLTESEIAQCD